ncbi:MAG TPA: hypothetical protein VMU02_10430 [bacterium]|nr:hypothetical protein [bacterium]
MKLAWLVALAVGFTLIWAMVVTAGPWIPTGGDPDIWDRAKPPVHNAPRVVSATAGTAIDIDMVVFKASLIRQDAPNKAKVDNRRLLTLSRPIQGLR